MPSQWVIRRNGDGCDVLWREGLGPQDRRSRLEALLADGMTPLEADIELRLAQGTFTRCNETQVFSHAASVEFVLSYAKPGDVLVDEGAMLVYMEPAKA